MLLIGLLLLLNLLLKHKDTHMKVSETFEGAGKGHCGKGSTDNAAAKHI